MHRSAYGQNAVAPAEIEKVHDISSPAAPTPATDGERVYVYFGSYGLVSYDLEGKLLWERRLTLPQNIYGAVASPIVAGELLVLNHQGKESYLLGVNRRDGKTVWKTDRSKYQYGWSTPVYWRHDGIDEILVLGGDFGPNQRLMAYNLADGAERWWVAGLPPCGKSTPVIGGGMVFFAAPDIIMDVEAEKKNPDRTTQIYANNASRVMAVRPGGMNEVNQTHVVWSEHKGTPGVPSPLYYNGASIRSKTAASFSLESQRPASWLTADEQGQWDITTRHPSPQTTRSTLRLRREWWWCWMAGTN
jgi:hypothetical protein